MFNFLSLFRKKKKIALSNGLNKDVVEGFIDKIEDIICISDVNYNIEYINKPNMNNKYNYLLDLLSYEENKELYNKIIETVKTEGFYSGNIEIEKKNQKARMYIAIYFIGSLNKYLAYIKDTDKYFKNENMLKEELNKSNEALRNKELFVANLSHEIKTPINIIIAMIYFLKSTKLDEVQNEYLNRLEGASDLLTELVNNILNVTKSDKVTNAINTKELFVLKDLIQKVQSIFEDDIKKKNIHFSVESSFDLNIEIYEDKTRLEQIFINLISNSVKYTDKGYIELEVRKIEETVEDYKIRFCVKDTGIGIKKEDTIKIFKEFEQTADPTIKEKEGFGLGLPLVKKIIESMGGKIWLESSYGLGTKIFFELNLLKHNNKPQKIEKTKVDDIYNNVSISNKILLVDDNEIINQITEKILNEIGIECDIAKDGMEAIKRVEENGPNYYQIILMDIHMPKYNGYDISRIMKQDLNVTTPIVALTATNITESVIEENAEFIYSYIQKPVKPEELKNIVKNIIKDIKSISKPEQRRGTVLLVGNKIKNWEVVENLNNMFNVICTLNTKDIEIITQTKKLVAIVVDKEEDQIQPQYIEDLSQNIKLFLEYNLIDGKQEDIKITDIQGYTKTINDISSIGFVLQEIIERTNKENNIEDTIEGYNNEISEIYKFLYDSLVNLTSIRSKETGSHLMRTQEYIKVMLREYERVFNTREFEEMKKIEDIGVAATLHDIGKVGIPDEILNKPGKLTQEEYDKIKQHVIIGYQILENTSSDKLSNNILEYAKEMTLHHHEKYDGTGYPDGLKGDEINILSKFMAVIDVYDALVNDRVYKEAMPYDEVEKYIVSQSGVYFDPKVVNIFLNIKDKLKEINEKYREEG